MQDYIDIAARNGVTLIDHGSCQFCGAKTKRGIHECLEIFNLGFQGIDFSSPEHHIFRFLIVDAHTLQHPEIHGRWNNHFHLTRLHLIFRYQVNWTYQLSPKLSDHLNRYKMKHPNEYLTPPPALYRGTITTTDVQDSKDVKKIVMQWAQEVYSVYQDHHNIVDRIAQNFMQ